MGAGLGLALEMGKAVAQNETNARNRQFQREMYDIQAKKNIDVWKATSYPAEIEQMKKAGINPGLVYGMGGGGGHASAGGVPNTVQAESPLKYMDAQAQAAQIALLQAQKQNIEADTKNKESQAGYTSGAQTEKTAAETKYIEEPQTTKTEAEKKYLEGVQTEKTDAEAKKIEQERSTEIAKTGIARIQLEIAGKTSNEQVAIIRQEARKIEGEAETALAQGKINRETVATQINQKKMDLLATAIHNKLMESQKNLTDKEAWALGEKVAQDWKNTFTNVRNADTNQTNAFTASNQQALNQFVNDVSNSTKLNYEWAGDVIKGVGIPLGLQGMKIAPPRTVVEGFKR